jgi:DNA-binding CsgD family transcriptional regulator
MVKLKNEILQLREEGLSYNQISEKLKCSKSVISYHCKRWSLTDIGLFKGKDVYSLRDEIKEYYKSHTKKETADFFGISESSVTRYKEYKREILDDSERKRRKSIYYLSFRQKLKKRCIEYKGGKCIICGYDNCDRALDFHHRVPSEKDFEIASSKVLAWEKIKVELDKCDLVCKNCHAEIHDKLDKEKD